MDPWYRVVTPRKEVRDGRSFNPDEFAIALEQVAAGTAPDDYRKPEQFFSRTCFTRAFCEHVGMVLRRLSGKTENTSPVMTLLTQFGGGKTHTLTALYHLANGGKNASKYPGVADLLQNEGLSSVPATRVGLFVGNAWDPREGRETPWIDIARQLAGSDGVLALGTAAQDTPPGTETLQRVFKAAGGKVLILFDEVLNFINRHRNRAEQFYAFIQNLNTAITGTPTGAALMSLPRSQVEMTEWDLQWQERINKLIRRQSKDLIANDEAEISEVVRRRLFDDLGSEKVRRSVARAYAEWCFERRAQLPPEWTAVDSAASEKKARDSLQARFEACYPFHPATLSVFQRKWQVLPQYQQTRGTLAMLAQWISWAHRDGYRNARTEPLITLGSAPLEETDFRSVVLGQLGESRLDPAIMADLVGTQAHAKALDADAKGPLRKIHQRVGTAILFESSGGQRDKVAHLPELRFALGEPETDTTSVDSAAAALEARAYFIARVGSDGYRIHQKAKITKVVNDRRASLDTEAEVKPTLRALVEKEFRRGASIPIEPFPSESTAIPDSPRLTLVVADPEDEWNERGEVRAKVLEWTRRRGQSDRLYPGALLWCLRKPGRELRDRVELLLAWKRVQAEIKEGHLGADLAPADRSEVQAGLDEAEDRATEEVWASYRHVALLDSEEPGGLKVIDLGAGHSSGSETLCGRIIANLKSYALVEESVGAGIIDRNWPDSLTASGAWPLSGLRQTFVNGTLTRLLDPDRALRQKIPEFVRRGDFGLAAGSKPDGRYERIWHAEEVSPDEIRFDSDVFLLKKATAEALKRPGGVAPDEVRPPPALPGGSEVVVTPPGGEGETEADATRCVRLVGTIPPELWNRLGMKVIPKLRSAGADLQATIDLQVTVGTAQAEPLRTELRRLLAELGLADRVRIE